MIIYGLAVIYLAVSTGFTVNFHYCFGQFESASLGNPTTCSGGKMKVTRSCCKTEHVTVSVKDKHITSATNSLAPLFIADLPVMFNSGLAPFAVQAKVFNQVPNKAPPDGLSNPLYLTFGNFRI